MSGLQGGYMPDSCDVSWHKSDAVESLGSLWDLSEYKKRILRRDMVLEVGEKNSFGYYTQYCSIDECTCNEPWIHSDSMSEEEWKLENS